MRQFRRFSCATFAFAMLAMVAEAQTAAQNDAQPGGWTVRDLDAPISDQFGFPTWLRFAGQYRGRLEDDTALSFVPGAADTYYLERIRVSLSVLPTPWLRFSADFQDAHNFLYGNRAFPAYTSDPFDLHQAYMEIGVPEGTGFSAKVGRQEVMLGSMRLIGSGDWLNTGRSRTSFAAPDY